MRSPLLAWLLLCGSAGSAVFAAELADAPAQVSEAVPTAPEPPVLDLAIPATAEPRGEQQNPSPLVGEGGRRPDEGFQAKLAPPHPASSPRPPSPTVGRGESEYGSPAVPRGGNEPGSPKARGLKSGPPHLANLLRSASEPAAKPTEPNKASLAQVPDTVTVNSADEPAAIFAELAPREPEPASEIRFTPQPEPTAPNSTPAGQNLAGPRYPEPAPLFDLYSQPSPYVNLYAPDSLIPLPRQVSRLPATVPNLVGEVVPVAGAMDALDQPTVRPAADISRPVIRSARHRNPHTTPHYVVPPAGSGERPTIIRSSNVTARSAEQVPGVADEDPAAAIGAPQEMPPASATGPDPQAMPLPQAQARPQVMPQPQLPKLAPIPTLPPELSPTEPATPETLPVQPTVPAQPVPPQAVGPAPVTSRVGPLSLGTLAFCRQIVSFGVYNRFERDEFAPGQEVLLYAEVDNFRSATTPKGFHTSIRSGWRIFDRLGNQVAQREFPVTEDYCRNRRRDYFHTYRFALPTYLRDGDYRLELILEDVHSGELAWANVPFRLSGPTTKVRSAQQ